MIEQPDNTKPEYIKTYGGSERFFDQNLGHIDDMEMKRSLEEALERVNKDIPTFKPDSIVQTISDRFIDRAKKGYEKYGTNLDRKDLTVSEWIQHLQDELHDAYLYSEKFKQDQQKSEHLLRLCMHMLDHKSPRALNQEELTEFQDLRTWYNEQKEKAANPTSNSVY
jgi:hypothetical protein